jgi:transposase InsO family protein
MPFPSVPRPCALVYRIAYARGLRAGHAQARRELEIERSALRKREAIGLRILLLMRLQLRIFTRKKPAPRMTEAERYWLARLAKRIPANYLRRYVYIRSHGTLANFQKRFASLAHYLKIRYGKWKAKRARLRAGLAHERPGRPLKYPEFVEIIRNIKIANIIFGYRRIRDELKILDKHIPDTTLRRYLKRLPEYRKRVRKLRRIWKSFLRRRAPQILAMDLLTFYTVFGRPLYVFFLIHHGRRRVLHVNATYHPTADWICRQLTDVLTDEDVAEKYLYLIHDRDAIFSPQVRRRIRELGLKSVRTAVRAPWQNGIAERFVQTLKRELLHRRPLFTRAGALRRIRQYVRYYNRFRPHQGLDGDSPEGLNVTPCPFPGARPQAIPECGGLYHRFMWPAQDALAA